MKSDTNILEELQQIAPVLVAIKSQMPNAVPAFYFDTLSDDILCAIAADALPKIQLPYTVSDKYFEQMSNNFFAKLNNGILIENVVNKELQTIAPMLATISKVPVFSVPQNYFELLNTSAVLVKSNAKIVAINQFKKWMIYAVAACMVGIVSVSVFISKNGSSKINYATYKNFDVANSINDISNEDLINYLENVNTITNSNSLTTLDIKLPEVQDHLQTISDEDLQQYLKDATIPLSEDKKEGI